MIIGIGTDIVDIGRIKKLMAGEQKRNQFLNRVFTDGEQKASAKYKDKPDQLTAFFAKRFAAKEAVVKALGTGFRDGLFLKDIDIYNDDLGKPHVHLSGGALTVLNKISGVDVRIHLSLSDDGDYAMAYVVIETI